MNRDEERERRSEVLKLWTRRCNHVKKRIHAKWGKDPHAAKAIGKPFDEAIAQIDVQLDGLGVIR